MEQVLFEVQQNDDVGRFAVASADLKQGDVIFTEKPFAFGPKTDSPPICLGCHAAIDCTVVCSVCNWPVCGSSCEALPAHRLNECAVFSKAKVKFIPVEDVTIPCLQYECITPLRVLLEVERDPFRWKNEVQKMEAHNSIRKELPIWEFNRVNVVEYLRGPCGLNRFDADLIHTICGILDVNSFEAYTLAGYVIRCLYPKLAILSHSCISNITHSIASEGVDENDEFRVTVRASVKINKGSELYSSYTYSLWPTLIRREYLKESKYFDCTCQRCADPTEMGTHMSSLKCTKCDNGVITSSAPLDPDSQWNCSHCEFNIKGGTVRKIFNVIQTEINSVEEMAQDASAIEAREQLCKKYRSVLHPRQAYFTMLRVSLAQMYGKTEGYTMDLLPDILFERKIELCQQILENINVIEPGYTRLRGMILYELHAPIILLTRNLYNAGCIDKTDLRLKLKEAMKLLEEATNILSVEPKNTREGMIGQVAKDSLQQLKDNFDDLVENA